ncbi:type II toxin-antitoxin system RelE/ParE family toxin [Nocardia amamiensis]|uniref:type II toxin-antitoxin system RelE/ParE family toxin n=1 Tax=Nocardia amamiensis TaxID=404578 RepID=UPI0034DD187E
MLYEILAEPEVVEFLYCLDPASRAAADHRAGLLAELGPQLGEPYSRFLGDGVRELRFVLSTSQSAHYLLVPGRAGNHHAHRLHKTAAAGVRRGRASEACAEGLRNGA